MKPDPAHASPTESIGLAPRGAPYVEPTDLPFRARERRRTTILIGGLTPTHDAMVEAAWRHLGYRVEALPPVDEESLRLGREFGSPGLCNPAHFTSGNLLKYLVRRRDVDGLSAGEIARRYAFLTAGACGPCRFGCYVAEYRRALREAGFPGVRVLAFQQMGGLRQDSGEDTGLTLTPRFFHELVRALLVADVLHLLAHRLRPYETIEGSTDLALERATRRCRLAVRRGHGVVRALRACRREFARVRVDRLATRPRVALIGEFWAMTTTGAGNHRMQRFLEQEGAEVEVEPLVHWLLYMVWQREHDTRRRMDLRRPDAGPKGLAGRSPWRTLLRMRIARGLLRSAFAAYARAVGLFDAEPPDMEEMARLASGSFDPELRGGEGHLEIARTIRAARDRDVHLVLSVKPFGCLPSSGVSDGVQPLLAHRHPGLAFCSVETTGDAPALVHSRVQMAVSKAKEGARREMEALVRARGVPIDEVRRRIGHDGTRAPDRRRSRHRRGSTAADLYDEVAGR